MTWTGRIKHIGGERVLVVDRDVPDDASQELKEALARRRIVNAGGQCPCGAKLIMPNRAQRRAAARRGEPLHAVIWHEPGCPAPLGQTRRAGR